MTVPILTGPTAVGKSDIALHAAELIGAEIISADSRQVYRGLNIGTAKPSRDDLERVPHHFISEKDPGADFSCGIFEREARARIRDIHRRGHHALVVGGSTLYIESLVNGFADIPTIDPSIRSRLNERLDLEGAELLYRELLAVDPPFANTLDSTKSQRIVRGLEVYEGTGQPLSSWFEETSSSGLDARLFVLNRKRSNLYDRINARVDRMLDTGLISEVRSLLNNGIDPHSNALRTIGYREVIAFLNGACDEQEMVRLIKVNTRRYAKRQLTWFRRYESAEWIDLDQTAPESILDLIQRTTK